MHCHEGSAKLAGSLVVIFLSKADECGYGTPGCPKDRQIYSENEFNLSGHLSDKTHFRFLGDTSGALSSLGV